tara:strand:- start:171 stop:578 length:408 start_codon:yes stop_codon:yes gene_type:complete
MIAFHYIGAYISEREKLIEDGQADDLDSVNEIKAYQVAQRCEQSDMVMVLLNLAVIPDEVVQKIDFKRGWQKRFKRNMKKYKKSFPVRWKYQDEDLEVRYARFVKEAEKKDKDLAKDIEEYKTEQAKAEKRALKR